MRSFCKRILLTLSACFVVTLAMAQPKNNSLFSRFGIGDLLNQNFTNLRATPGFTNAYNNPYHLNLQNPASLGFMQMAAIDFGVYGRRSIWESGEETNINWSGNMSHLAIGFTVNNPVNDLLERERQDFSWGMSFALVPYSLVGFTVRTEGEVPDIGNVISEFRGEGGTNQLLWSNGFRYKQFSAGLNLGYLFGKIENVRGVIFDDLNASFQNRFVDDYSINGITWRIGAQYNFIFNAESGNLNKIKVLTLGVTASTNNRLNTNSSRFNRRFNPPFVTSGVAARDTLAFDTIIDEEDVEGKATLPAQFGVGAIFSSGSKFKVGINYDFVQWSNYTNDAQPEELENTYQLGFGAEWIPNFASYNKFFERVRYRVGGFIGTDPRNINGEQIERYAVTFGLGIPITLPRKQLSFVNLSVELGKMGHNTSLVETYGEFTIGFTLNDNGWFVKQKFN